MSAVQFFLILLPMSVNVYLLKTVSFELYGKFIFFLSLFNFLSILTNSGVANDSLRDLSSAFNRYIDKFESEEFNKKMSEYIGIKLFYLTLSFLLCFLLSFFDVFHEPLFYCLFIYLVYFCLDFFIFYQIINKMIHYVFVMISSFSISILSLFYFIHGDKDIYYVSFVVTLPFICLNFILLLYNLYVLNFRININMGSFVQKVKNNYRLMFTNITSALVTKGIYLFIGSALGVREVAIYSVLDQICRAPLIFINRLSTLYTPKIVQVISQNNKFMLQGVFSKVFFRILILSLSVCVFLAVSSKIILPFLIDEQYLSFEEIIPLFLLMLMIIPSISLSSLCAMQYYLNMKNDLIIYRYSIALLILGLPFIVICASLFNLSGLILSYVFVELLALLYFLWYLDFNPLQVCYVNFANKGK
ncbi:lipopolysaccharide biosynthesis protein [Vibrio rhizosphaerae]|uniref:lipopolysaccharide biosynthesis protein n=1 Tax=Vibrio rhizosphaerae TaxID=398736 RepID=UPI00146FA911|nr:oligosaccharide flippase family protein [Vibrio rhizosphaerae]